MSFKTWLHNDFKPLYEDATLEEPLDKEGALDQQKTAAEVNANTSNTPNAFRQYITSDGLTEHLAKLGGDIGEAVLNFAIKEFVNPEMFDSKDNYDKYVNAMNQKIGLDYKKRLIEVLSNAGVFIENTKRSLSKIA